MCKRVRHNAALMMLTGVVLLGCTAPRAAVPGAVAAGGRAVRPEGQAGAGFSLNTPVDAIAADPRGKMVLRRDLPGLMANPKYPLFCDMSLNQLAELSSGKLTAAKLAQVQGDLTLLGAPGP